MWLVSFQFWEFPFLEKNLISEFSVIGNYAQIIGNFGMNLLVKMQIFAVTHYIGIHDIVFIMKF